MILEAIIHLCGAIAEFWVNLTGFRDVNRIMLENLEKQRLSQTAVNRTENSETTATATPESTL